MNLNEKMKQFLLKCEENNVLTLFQEFHSRIIHLFKTRFGCINNESDEIICEYITDCVHHLIYQSNKFHKLIDMYEPDDFNLHSKFIIFELFENN